MDEFVHTAWSQRRAHGIHHGLAGINVADELSLTLARVRAFLQQNDLWLLLKEREKGEVRQRHNKLGAKAKAT